MTAPTPGPSWCAAAPDHARCAKLGHRSPILRVDPVRLQLLEARAAGAERPRVVFLEVSSGDERVAYLLTLDQAGEVRDAFTQVTTWAGETA